MNSKYFGNSLDLMKYDLLTHLVTKSEGLGLFYVPMLTEPMPKERTPKHETYEIGMLNWPLLQLMKHEYKKETFKINVIKKYFVDLGIHLSVLNPKDVGYFNEDNRRAYFNAAIGHYKSLVNPTLVFVDPDVGCDVGVIRRYRTNKHMYLRKHEAISFQQNLRKGDILSYFQHLGNANYTLTKRMKDLNDAFGDWVLFVAYTRIQAGFVFVFNDEATYHKMHKSIKQYYCLYASPRHKDKFIICGRQSKEYLSYSTKSTI